MDKKAGIFSGLRKLEEQETIVPLKDLTPFSFSRLPGMLDYLDRLTRLRDGARLPLLSDVEGRIVIVCDSIEKELGLKKSDADA